MIRAIKPKTPTVIQRVCQLSPRFSTTQASQIQTSTGLNVGDELHGYTVQKVEEVPELFITAYSLEHDKTGAKHLHLARDDTNNTFSVAFRTTPMDNTGVPHILEHTVLCGSKKFPVRDPFFKMLNRSLATFMNALTASDWTMYPFSTQNRRDFNNLLSIYLDAVFYPQLRELDFSQEGWRLEHQDVRDRNSPLGFKGVVYNEMKGVFSSSDAIFAEAVQNNLLPNHTYGVVSGGDPAYIPDLTWNHLKEFHQSHYHPSNSRFYTYGSFPLEEHLEFINENYLQYFDKIKVDTQVPLEPRWQAPREKSISCQPDTMAPDPTKQTTVAVNFLLTDITDPMESFTLSILSALLTDGETSPFYQALIDANLGSDYSPVIGYNGYTKESSFSVGLQGLKKEDPETVKQIIAQTIDKVISEGFDQSRIDALLHRIELTTKHQTSNFGLGIIMSISSAWTHEGDAAELLKVNEKVKQFKQRLAENPQYLQQKVKQYLKDNLHQLTVVMSPDETYQEQKQKQEEEKLQRCIDQLNDEQREHIFKLGQELQEAQNSVEDLACLPCIQLGEIDRKITPEIVENVIIDDVPVQFSCQPTNEVTYLKLVSHLDNVPEEMKMYVPLFASVISKMGAGPYDYRELSHLADLHTGGLNSDTHICADPVNVSAFDEGVMFTSHCLERNFDKMLELWTEVFDRSNLRDSDRLQTLIRMTAQDMAAGLAHAGHSYAMTHSSSSLTPASKRSEIFSGITQVSVMKRIAESPDNSKIMEHLIEIGKCVLNKNNLRLSVNATPDFMPTALKSVEQFLGDLHSSRKPEDHTQSSHTIQGGNFESTSIKTHIQLPFSVNYMSKSVKTVPYSHGDFPSLRVLSRLLSWKFLHKEIREKGGAYGGGASCANGVMSFFSYRDPNSMETLSVFDRSVDWAASGQFTDKDVDEAKISVFQQIDKPVPPGKIGTTLFFSKITDEMRQAARDGLFSVTRDSLVNATQKYLVQGKQPSSTSFLGPSNDSTKDKDDWKVLKE